MEMESLVQPGKYRDLHLGVDFGTSASKMVLRDFGAAGGEQSYLLGGNGFRYTSSMLVREGTLYFGENAAPNEIGAGASLYQSIKMRIADDVIGVEGQHFYGQPTPYPDGISGSDLATIYLWHLISKAHYIVTQNFNIRDPRIGVTIGTPMSFYEDKQLRNEFITIARSAYYLYKSMGVRTQTFIPIREARDNAHVARNVIEGRSPLADDQVRNWVRSEAEAAMLWAFRSPRVQYGRYFEMDIGAGTTNSSVFNISAEYVGDRWVKSGIVFYGASSSPKGMDMVCEQIANNLNPIRPLIEIRESENSHLGDDALFEAIRPSIEELREVMQAAWRHAYRNIQNPNELNNWNGVPMFVLGGGSKVDRIKDLVAYHPSQQMDEKDRRLRSRNVARPADLNGDVPAINTGLPFVMVAYGLSNLDLAVPDAVTPQHVEPMQRLPRRPNLNFDEIYSD